MKRKFLTLTLLACMLASCSNNSTNTNTSVPTSQNQIQSTSTSTSGTVVKQVLGSKLYDKDLSQSVSLPTTYFESEGDVPYVTLNAFLAFLTPLYTVDSTGTVTNTYTKVTIKFDVNSNTISSDDYDKATSPLENDKLPLDMANSKQDILSSYDVTNSTYTKGEKFEINLNNYHAKMISYGGKVYVPFAYVEAIFMSPLGARFAFNGSDYYMIDNDYLIDSTNSTETNTVLSAYGNAYYNGAYSKLTSRSTSFSNYFYYSFLFEMENFYGRYKELNITSLDEKLNSLKLTGDETLTIKQAILSSSSATASAGIADAINQVFGDGGHTSFVGRGSSVTFDSTINTTLIRNILFYDNRYANNLNNIYRPLIEAFKNNNASGYQTYGSTAVIRMENFSIDAYQMSEKKTADPTYYPTAEIVKAGLNADKPSTFSILYSCFEKITADSTIKNVVFDITLNSGGAVCAMLQALTFMSSDASASLYIKNTKTGAISKETVKYDNNLDKKFDSKDSYAGKYNFFILTSGFSYSCGNSFPCIAKDNNLATIIGQTSGGGNCTVANCVGADGITWSMSSNYSMVHKDGTGVDNGQKVDYECDSSTFYDMTKLDTFVNNINSKKS